jgi:GH43 family beta-xylosidase
MPTDRFRSPSTGVILTVLAALVVLSACTDHTPGKDTGTKGAPHDPLAALWHQPLDLPMGNHGAEVNDLADPHVLFDDGRWYLYPTHTKHDLEVWTSEDLVTWTWGGVIWSPTPGSWNDQGEVWAPSIHPADDGWYLYYTAGLRIGVAWSADPGGPFVDVRETPLIGGGHGGVGDGEDYDPDDFTHPFNFEEFSIDAFVLEGAEGQDEGLTLYCTSYSPASRLIAVPLSDPTTVAGDAPTVVLTPDATTWEGAVTEGPWLLERDGQVHMMYSGNYAETQNYGMGAAVAPGPLGPFERYTENPLLEADPADGLWGPGHHAVAPGPEGALSEGQMLMFYHAKNAPASAWNRHIRLGGVAWSGSGAGARLVLDPPLPD